MLFWPITVNAEVLIELGLFEIPLSSSDRLFVLIKHGFVSLDKFLLFVVYLASVFLLPYIDISYLPCNWICTLNEVVDF